MMFNRSKKYFSTLYKIPEKVAGFEKPTIWYKYSRLALTTNSINLGQGFPDWKPPEFLLDNIQKHISNPNANYQYTRSFGNLKLAEVVSQKYGQILNRKIDHVNEVLIANGAVSLLYSIITGIIEQGDEVISMEPFYDCYLPQVQFVGGKYIGIPMIPPKFRNKTEFLNVKNKIIKDEWKIDFEKLRNSLNEKTRILILNTPSNPTGKILTNEELKEIAKILEKFPRVIVLSDEVYEHMVYDEFKLLPRIQNINNMWERTISVYSAGKFFSATGIRIGWCIGPKQLIQITNSIHQFSSFCMFDPTQLAVADSLLEAQKPYKGFSNYYEWLRNLYTESRNYFIENLANIQNFDCNFYMPEGSYFVIADISHKKNEAKYKFEGEENEPNNYSKDFNYLLNMANEKKVVGIPCSPFYTNQNKHLGENFIRLAFCKKKETMDLAFKNLDKI